MNKWKVQFKPDRTEVSAYYMRRVSLLMPDIKAVIAICNIIWMFPGSNVENPVPVKQGLSYFKPDIEALVAVATMVWMCPGWPNQCPIIGVMFN